MPAPLKHDNTMRDGELLLVQQHCPAVDGCGVNLCPVLLGLVGVVLVQRRHKGRTVGSLIRLEVGRPVHILAAAGSIFVGSSQELVGGLSSVGEGHNTEGINQDAGSLGIGDTPVQEVLRGLLVSLGSLGVDAPIVPEVLGSFLIFALDAVIFPVVSA